MIPDSVFIIADIEGSSGCMSKRASEFLNEEWYRACYDMTMDVLEVAEALLQAGVKNIYIKDFHRTAYNLMKEFFPEGVHIISGYKQGPVPGIGDTKEAECLLMLGMHASSGSEGFLAHTFTSRISELKVNGSRVAEVQLFASSLSGSGIRPVFFSGCPVACDEAQRAVPFIDTCVIDKTGGPAAIDKLSWRKRLARDAVSSLLNEKTEALHWPGSFDVTMKMRDGSAEAQKLAQRWGLDCSGDEVMWKSSDFESFYATLIKVCYFTPFIEKILPAGLGIYNLAGWLGLHRARFFLKKQGYEFP